MCRGDAVDCCGRCGELALYDEVYVNDGATDRVALERVNVGSHWLVTIDVQRHVSAATGSLEQRTELTSICLNVDWLHTLAIHGGWQNAFVAQ